MTCKKMRVKKKKVTRNELLGYISAAQVQQNYYYISQLEYNGQLILPKAGRMQKNPFLKAMEEKYNQECKLSTTT